MEWIGDNPLLPFIQAQKEGREREKVEVENQDEVESEKSCWDFANEMFNVKMGEKCY